MLIPEITLCPIRTKWLRKPFLLVFLSLFLLLMVGGLSACCGDAAFDDSQYSGLTIYVASSVGGEPLTDVQLQIKKNPPKGWGSVLGAPVEKSSIKTGVDGALRIESAKQGEVYSVLATKPGFASTLLQECEVVGGAQSETLILLPKLDSTQDGRQLGAPYLELLTPNFPSNTEKSFPKQLSLAPESLLSLNLFSKEAVEKQFSHDAISMAVDQMPSGFIARQLPRNQFAETAVAPTNKTPYWTTQVDFAVERLLPEKSDYMHSLNWVATDIANNRVQKRIYFRSTAEQPQESTKILPPPSVSILEARTFAVDRMVFSSQSTRAPKDCTAYTVFTIENPKVNGEEVPLLYDGYEIARSEEEHANFVIVKKISVPLNEFRSSKQEILDDSPNLELGHRYYYKIRGYQAIQGVRKYTQWIDVGWVQFLPKLQLGNFNPQNGVHSYGNVTFRFQIQNFNQLSAFEGLKLVFSLRLATVDGNWSFMTPDKQIPQIQLGIDKKKSFHAQGYYAASQSEDLGSSVSFNSNSGVVLLQLAPFMNIMRPHLIAGSARENLVNKSYNWFIDGVNHGAYVQLYWKNDSLITPQSWARYRRSRSYASSKETEGVVDGRTFNIHLSE